MAAAGLAEGVTVDSNWPPTGYGNDLGQHVQILEGMASEVGFKFNTTSPTSTPSGSTIAMRAGTSRDSLTATLAFPLSSAIRADPARTPVCCGRLFV